MDKRILRSKIHTWARMRAAGPMKDRRKEMTDEDHIEEGLDERADCPWKCYPDDPKCLCERKEDEKV